jgi:hypothetical protein
MPKPAENQEAAPWRVFPTIEKVFGTDFEGFLGRSRQTCGELNEMIENGSPRDAARARSAMAAYGKTLELLQELRRRMEDGDGAGGA